MMSCNEKKEKLNIRIIGIGGGGVNIVDCLQELDGFSGECILMDTHIQSLQFNNAPKKVQLGKHITGGRGAANPLTGIDSAVDSFDEIREVISGADVIFVVACMGGGTSTSYADDVKRDAEERLGKRVAAYDEIIRARRVFALMTLDAPSIIIEIESQLLAQAMVINRFAISKRKER